MKKDIDQHVDKILEEAGVKPAPPKYPHKNKENKPKQHRIRNFWKRVTEEPPQKSQEEVEKEENTLYNAIIISLAIGIVIVIATLIIARPAPEYFTELYFMNHTNLPKYIQQGSEYEFNTVIHNVENGTHNYQVKISGVLYTKNNSARQGFEYYTNISIGKNDLAQMPMKIKITEPFYKAKVQVDLLDKGEEVHFWAYNRELVYEYPDTIASIYCLNSTINLTKQDSFIVSAKGELSPAMKIRINGEQIFNTTVTDPTNYTINHQIGTGLLDIVFDNYKWNASLKKDRALTINYIQIGNITIKPQQGILDGGKDSKAFDCESIQTGKPNMVVKSIGNSALRFKLEEK